MRVMVLTQDDVFFIPANVRKLSSVADIVEVVVIDSKGSLSHMGLRMLSWFGMWQCLKMGLYYGWRRFLDLVDRLSGWRVLDGEGSLRSLCTKSRVPYRVITNVNDPSFVDHVRELSPDLIVSYSAPQVVKEPLLSMPKHGIINVHGSLLPDFRGLLPSFWVLFEGERETGATVHFMSDEIDGGRIIMQGRVPIRENATMFNVMSATKRLGGDLVVESVRAISHGTIPEFIPNRRGRSRYYSWPTKEQARAFRVRGGRLI